ncbi:ABC transporter substrate-binding protein [Devosia ginsengisoli]|uniref:ABC transporter substrate-binding protein n=1 Tax=Devosia ginsengisoli TaxID=400770 RepID=UPI0026F25619|nr:extracellular solute-binding protein [Devosia ginsengisoli]MCR6671289.1 extracellular solute-binding protein [Devosia ginsengisoli]
MWTFLNPENTSGREVALRNVIEKYEANHPGVDIVVEPQDWATMTEKFVLSHSANRAPDIIWSAQDLGLLVNSGAVTSLNPYLADWLAENDDDLLFDNAYDNATYDGELMAVPLFPYSVLVFYRKDHFAQVGLTEDDLDTWDGFAAAVKKLQDAGLPGLLLPLSEDKPSSTIATTAYMDLNDGHLLAEGCVADFATDIGVQALTLQTDMIKSGLISQEAVARTNDDAWDLFIGGRGSIVPQTSARAGALLSSSDWANEETVGIVPWPSFTTDHHGPSVGASWQVSLWSGSQNKEEASDFMAFMASEEGAKEWAVTGEQLPLRASVANLPELSGGVFALNQAASEALNETGRFPRPGCAESSTMGDWNRAAQDVLLNGISPVDALQEATDSTNRRQ